MSLCGDGAAERWQQQQTRPPAITPTMKPTRTPTTIGAQAVGESTGGNGGGTSHVTTSGLTRHSMLLQTSAASLTAERTEVTPAQVAPIQLSTHEMEASTTEPFPGPMKLRDLVAYYNLSQNGYG